MWGFASVVESRCAGVDVGERFYGFWPIADEAVLQPARVNAGGFFDGAEHRRELHPVYNQYLRCSADPAYVAEREAEQALLRPLFGTSFLIDDFLAYNRFFGARTVILSSASSKTAYGTAFCLALRRGATDAVKVIGLTSPGNVAFTRSLGCYDEVLCYDDVPTALADEPAVYVDFSGSVPVRAAVHERLADTLAYSCSVGGTHWDTLGPDAGSATGHRGNGLPGPRPVFFFAPNQAKKRSGDWGPAGLQERLAAAWAAFMQPVTRADDPCLQVVRGRGTAAVEACYAALLDGTVRPQEGHILSLQRGMPQWFDAEARAEWQRVVPGIERLDLINPLDRAMLVVYTETWATYTAAVVRIRVDGLTMTNPDSGHTSAHPCVQIANTAAGQLRAFAAEFGLSAVAERRSPATNPRQ